MSHIFSLVLIQLYMQFSDSHDDLISFSVSIQMSSLDHFN